MNKKLHNISISAIEKEYLYLFVDNVQYKISWSKCSQKLANASQFERGEIQIAPSGYGIHWPVIDEDLAIEPLLKSAVIINEKETIKTKNM